MGPHIHTADWLQKTPNKSALRMDFLIVEQMAGIEPAASAWKAEVLPLYDICILERKTRFELATLALARRCSTPEPLPHMLVEGDGFEPSKAQLTDLQSAPFGHSGIPR